MMAVFEKYCTRAIAPMATIRKEASCDLKAANGPKKKRTAETVRKVEQTIMAELKKTVIGFLLMRNPENKPSAAARNIPASPP